MTTQVTVNGETVVLDGPVSVQDVVAHALSTVNRAAGGRGVAVAVNDDVVPRGRWTSTTVSAGDRIEILTATQGG